MTRLRLLILLAATVASLAPLAAPRADEIEGKTQELDDLRARIKHHNRKAQELQQDEKSQLARLAEIEQEVALTTELLGKLAEREAIVVAELDTIHAAVALVDSAAIGRQDRLAARLRAMYMRPKMAGIAAMLRASSLSGLTARAKIITRIAQAEEEIITTTVASQQELALQQHALKANLSELQANRSEAENRRRALADLQEERKFTLAEVRKQRRRYQAGAEEMKKAAAALADVIAQLQQRGGSEAPSTRFGQNEGMLPWPVEGPVVRGFGLTVHPRFQTEVMNKGINIGAAHGTPIRAVADGVVEYVNWLPGYGKCLIVNHGDGFYTLYAHASQLFPLEADTVARGDVVGEVGDTGSLDGSQLYFEVRKGKEALDPRRWLSQPAR